jgi:DNA-binding transcriptional regulator YiaG
MTPTEFKQARKTLGLTQIEMGELLGVCETAVRKWETPETCSTNRKINPTAEKVVRWMMAGMKPSDYGG